MASHIDIIACSIFQRALEREFPPQKNMRIQFTDSLLHLYPEKLKQELDRLILKSQNENNDAAVILVFGECHPYMDTVTNSHVRRCKALNCIELLLGHDEYVRLRREGWFFLLHGWIAQWKNIFETQLNLNAENIREIMRQSHCGLLYLNTPFDEIPLEELESISRVTALPYSVRNTDYSLLYQSVHELIRELSDEIRH